MKIYQTKIYLIGLLIVFVMNSFSYEIIIIIIIDLSYQFYPPGFSVGGVGGHGTWVIGGVDIWRKNDNLKTGYR